MPRHLTNVHKEVKEVAQVLVLGEKKAKTMGLTKLVSEGIFKHNNEVMKNNRGDFIPARCLWHDRQITDYPLSSLFTAFYL